MKKILLGLMLCYLMACILPLGISADAAQYWDIWAYDGDYQHITISPNPAPAGQKVTVAPKDGYKIKNLIVCPSDSDPLPLKQEGANYTFTMPDGPVDVLVEVETLSGGGVAHSINLLSASNGDPVVEGYTQPYLVPAGEEVTIDPAPRSGFAFDHIQVDYYDETGFNVIYDVDKPVFIMPNFDVKVVVYYKNDGTQPPPAFLIISSSLS